MNPGESIGTAWPKTTGLAVDSDAFDVSVDAAELAFVAAAEVVAGLGAAEAAGALAMLPRLVVADASPLEVNADVRALVNDGDGPLKL